MMRVVGEKRSRQLGNRIRKKRWTLEGAVIDTLKCHKPVFELFQGIIMGTFIDLTGQRFGRWTVIERARDAQKKNIYWICRCDCGTIRSVAGTSLRSGISVSCGCEKDEKTSSRTRNLVEDLSGQRFGMWTVIQRDFSNNTSSKRGARWICRCDCGTERSVLGYALKTKRTTSCGCSNGEKAIIDLTGLRFGKLLVQERDLSAPNLGKGTRWICKCDCGKTVSVLSGRLRSGQTQSCGCNKNLTSIPEELEGKKFGSWIVQNRDQTKKGKGAFYICQCDCGNVRSIPAYVLTKGLSKSCGCKKSVPEEDLCGRQFGQLTVIGIDESKKGKGIYWLCRCDCGTTKSYRSNILKKGKVRSCGCLSRKQSSERNFLDIKGQRFGRLVVIAVDHKERDNSGNTTIVWRCKCDCGNEIAVSGVALRGGSTKSCGCLQAEQSAQRAKERTIDLRGKRFGLLTVVERVELDESGNGLGVWKCQCDCGNIKFVQGYSLRKGMVTSCGCLKQSRLELYVLQYFDEMGYINAVDYEYQKRYNDLRGNGNRMLSYDFAFYSNQKLCYLIECQGQQHYGPVGIFGGEEQFAKQQLYDEIKKEYASKLGVPLIEIPFFTETYEKVKELLKGFGI